MTKKVESKSVTILPVIQEASADAGDSDPFGSASMAIEPKVNKIGQPNLAPVSNFALSDIPNIANVMVLNFCANRYPKMCSYILTGNSSDREIPGLSR